MSASKIVVNSNSPLPIIFLIDGSYSMMERSSNPDFSKVEMVTGILNDLIKSMNILSEKRYEDGKQLSTRYIVGVVKYGGSHEAVNLCTEKYGVPLATVHHLGPKNSETTKRVTIQGDHQFEDDAQTWFETSDIEMGGWTPMYKGFEMAKELLQLLQDEPRCNMESSSFPLVINISDGEANQHPDEFNSEVSASQAAVESILSDIDEIEFGGGQDSWRPVIFNIFIGDTDSKRIFLPPSQPSPSSLNNEPDGLRLFDTSDVLPPDFDKAAREDLGEKLTDPTTEEELKCFVWNANASDLLRLMTWLSTVAIMGGED